MELLIRKWVMSCEQCIKESSIDDRLPRPTLQNPVEQIIGPEDAMQIDLVRELPPSSGYQKIVTAIFVFSRYQFAYSTANQDAKTVAKVITKIIMEHAHLATTITSDKGSPFVTQVIKEVADVLGITIEHARTKHGQTIGMLERTHASLEKVFKIDTGERRSMWHKYVNIAVLSYNTSNHKSFGCKHSQLFHGCVTYRILDMKTGNRPQKRCTPNSHIAQDVFAQTQLILQDVRRNAM